MVHPTEPLPSDVIAALERGDKIEAIKRLRSATGLGLAEAKSRIDRHPTHRPSAPKAPSNELPVAVLAALQSGKWLDAIRLLLAQSDGVPKEAKDLVAMSRQPIQPTAPPDGLSPGEVPRSEEFGRTILVVLVAALLGYLFFYR